jgi:tetratricopeptide (TPR) repeat protein
MIALGAGALGFGPATHAHAQEAAAATESAAEPGPPAASPVLAEYLDALAEKRLIASETGSLASLKVLLHDGERLYLEGRNDEASRVLFELVESPKFRDFAEEPEFRGAEYMLARSLAKLGAVRTAERYFARVLARGVDDPYFGPAFRGVVDAALESGALKRTIRQLESLKVAALPEDAANELRYLKGRERFDAGDRIEAGQAFQQITKTSRFYANGFYLRGVLAAKAGDLKTAEANFCAVATQGKNDTYSFYVDERYFEVKDLAHLALGRVAHEGRRAEDAFYYYFQVPQDSERVAEAMLEAAYAMYEGSDHDTAIDLLDQLEARFPLSAVSDEAKLLRGYIQLGRCDFDAADKLFVAFHRRFQPVLEEVNRILESPGRQGDLFEDLLVEERYVAEASSEGGSDGAATEGAGASATLLKLLSVDPDFYRLHGEVRTLDAEAARAGRLLADLEAIRYRTQGKEAPIPAMAPELNLDPQVEFLAELAQARGALDSLRAQLDGLRTSKVRPDELRALEVETSRLSEKIVRMDREVRRAAKRQDASAAASASGSGKLEALLDSDVARARELPAAVERVRAKLVDAGNRAAFRSLEELRDRLSKGLRRARIGRIDAVMGSKRRVEIQIESLAAGRFPPELMDPLRIQGLLRDDEEYWPYEGEYWADEFTEGTASEGGAK